MSPGQFLVVADSALTAMAERARLMGVEGVAVVALANLAPATGWTSLMRVVGNLTKGNNNLAGIAYGKAAEMADTLRDSGSGIRPPLHGENGYHGGLVRPLAESHVLAVFSGASGEQDVEIAQAAMLIFAQHGG